MHIIEHNNLSHLFTALRDRGYTVIGPTVREGAIVLDTINSVEELPIGWTDEQSGGKYALVRRPDQAAFGYVVGPMSWKRLLYQPRLKLFSANRVGKELSFTDSSADLVQNVPRLAFLGVRPCEQTAIATQDKVFVGGEFVDPTYSALRSGALIIGVNCMAPGGNCFCASMGTGPKATAGFDLSLTEILDEHTHCYAVETGSVRGEELLTGLPHRPPKGEEEEFVKNGLESASRRMGKSLNTKDLKNNLYENFEHVEWDQVTSRCLTCANCTMVCPTCFCSTVEDTTDLAGTKADRWRRWDSCFTMDFAKVAGGNTRPSTRARYRQWLMHKLGYWNDQFGVSGCVGCGRCITWCPVGIDITAEAALLTGSSSTTMATIADGHSRT